MSKCWNNMPIGSRKAQMATCALLLRCAALAVLMSVASSNSLKIPAAAAVNRFPPDPVGPLLSPEPTKTSNHPARGLSRLHIPSLPSLTLEICPPTLFIIDTIKTPLLKIFLYPLGQDHPPLCLRGPPRPLADPVGRGLSRVQTNSQRFFLFIHSSFIIISSSLHSHVTLKPGMV